MKGSRVAIVGVGETEYVRATERPLMALVVEACRTAVEDAGLTLAEIDGLVGASRLPMDEVAAALGLEETPFTAQCDVVAGAATAGSSLILAQLAIEAGLATAVLVPYGIKCSHPGGPYAFHAADPLKADLEMPVGYFGQPIYFAAMAQRYRHEHGLTEEELSAVPRAARAWAQLNPRAQKREPLDFAAYQRSPMIATPLRAADCCLMTDGACAYVVTSVARARDLRRTPAVISGVAVGANPLPQSMILSQNADVLAFPAAESSRKAYAMAGIEAKDVDVAQVYDCFSISTIAQAEMMGFCEPGEGGRFFNAGHTAPGGRMPINTSGGHLSGGYVPGANLVVEAVRQLRGERDAAQVPGVEVSIAGGLGGNAHGVAVFTRAH
ncbi:MAG TPA: thiolase family protein [Phenylobacterium sp.]|nr:thiolase family protein [Phenylobacterium sp.]